MIGEISTADRNKTVCDQKSNGTTSNNSSRTSKK